MSTLLSCSGDDGTLPPYPEPGIGPAPGKGDDKSANRASVGTDEGPWNSPPEPGPNPGPSGGGD